MINTQKTTVYFIPGMAAGPEIFDRIRLPKDTYDCQVLDWMIPEKDETLQHYAKRMADRVTAPNPILIGVSFGGIVAQEMSAFLSLKKLIIISSVKKRSELPRRMRFAGKTGLHKLIPISKVLSQDDLTKFSLGAKSKKRLTLYQKYLGVRDPYYLRWSIEEIVTWKREKTVPGLIHIQGDKDQVFPIKHIDDAEVIHGGTHIMVLNRAPEITRLLMKIFAK